MEKGKKRKVKNGERQKGKKKKVKGKYNKKEK